jgi:hypothetical protein
MPPRRVRLVKVVSGCLIIHNAGSILYKAEPEGTVAGNVLAVTQGASDENIGYIHRLRAEFRINRPTAKQSAEPSAAWTSSAGPQQRSRQKQSPARKEYAGRDAHPDPKSTQATSAARAATQRSDYAGYARPWYPESTSQTLNRRMTLHHFRFHSRHQSVDLGPSHSTPHPRSPGRRPDTQALPPEMLWQSR